MSPITKVTVDNFSTEVKAKDGLYILEFRSPVCPQCNILEPILNEVAEIYSDRAGFGVVDVTIDLSLAVEYGIMRLPVLLFFKQSVEQNRLVGLSPKDEITGLIESLLD